MEQADGRLVLCVMGPTASGKTDVALALRELLPVDIISVDSAMVYRGMDIGTAKPSLAVRQRHPHALVDIVAPTQAFSAAAFSSAAETLVRQSWRAGRLPLLVGGTLFWFKALLAGLNRLPAADAAVRAEIEAQARAVGWAALHAELAAVDPEAARRIHPNDPQRLQRALEIHRLTGHAPSKLMREPRGPGLAGRGGAQLVQLALVPADRQQLHRRIEARLQEMLAAGFIDEVRGLRARGELHAALPAMRAVGYRQIWQWLDDGGRAADRVRMQERCLAATRQLAKRQLTWLRRWHLHTPDGLLRVEPFAAQGVERACAQALRAVTDGRATMAKLRWQADEERSYSSD